MKALRTLAALLILGGIGAGAARAATDMEILSAKIGKYATLDVSRPRSYCVCQDGSARHGAAGIVAQLAFADYLGAFCRVHGYSVDGSQISPAHYCSTYILLAK